MNENWHGPDQGDWGAWTGAGSADGTTDPTASGAAPRSAAELQRLQSELWAALRQEDDPDVRMVLLSQLSEARSALLAIDAGPSRPAGTPMAGGLDQPVPPLAPGAGPAGSDAWPRPESPREPFPPRWRVGRHHLGTEPGEDPLGLAESGDDGLLDDPFREGSSIDDGFRGDVFADDGLLADLRFDDGPARSTGGVAAGAGARAGAEPAPYESAPYESARPRPMYQIGPSPDGPDGLPDLPSVFAGATASVAAPPPPPGLGDGARHAVGHRSLAGNGQGVADDRSVANRLASLGPLNGPQTGQRVLVLVGALLSVIGIGWLVLSNPFDRSGETAATADGPAGLEANESAEEVVRHIQAAVQGLGLTSVSVTAEADGIHLVGAVASQDQVASAIAVSKAIAGETPVVSELTVAAVTAVSQPTTPNDAATARVTALQNEINRVVAATPLIFETGKTDISELHARILNNVASILRAYPDLPVRVIGYTDHVGSADANTALSQTRAANVKTYLVSQGVPEGGLITEARGSSTSTGSADLAGLERRVEFEVVAVPVAAPAKGALRVAIVAPSARNDLAFTQSMVDAINVVAAERGNVQVDITDSTFVPAEAAAAIRTYAEGDYDLIIAHGVEFGPELVEIVQAHPGTVFAWGTATDTFGLPNLYAYDAAAEQGAYVMGAMSAMLTAKGVVGVVGPIEVADAKRYVNGFKSGAAAQKPDIQLPTTYTGSFGDIVLASEAAKGHVAKGADVLTGTAEMVVGAVQVARDSHALWFGTQANQTTLAPDIVVASQVYHWEVLLRQILTDIDAGTPNGRAMVATLADGGLVVEYNPAYPLADPVKQRAEQLIADIKSGALVVPVG